MLAVAIQNGRRGNKAKMKRCPWCGKPVNYRKEGRRVRQKKTPKAFKFARCSHCDHYYGQHVYSSKIGRGLFFSSLPVIILGFALQWYLLVVVYMFVLVAIGIAGVFFLPYRRMDENEDLDETEEGPSFRAAWSEEQKKIKRHKLYFLTDKFDEYPAFAAVSPICFDTVDRKNGSGAGHFLYAHPENVKYRERTFADLYDSDMRRVGSIRWLDREAPRPEASENR